MGQSSYDPYYLNQSHHHNHHQEAEYYYHHNVNESRNPILSYALESISTSPTPNIRTSIPIYIPKEQRHINTLFVSGLPDDVMPREIHNFFRRRPGFDSCQLKFTGRGNQVVAFVTFFNHQSAVLALQDLDGVKFDPQAGSILHIELARSNSRRKRKPGSGPYVVIDKRKRAADDVEDTSSDDDAGDNELDNQTQSDDPDTSNNNKDLVTVKRYSDEKKVPPGGTAAKSNHQTEKASEGDLRPCSTLFIANLGPNCSEDELRQALSQHSGFNGLKLRAKGGMPVAFADYEEVEQATHAMQALQDSMLASSDRGGMHIEYARSKMRKP